MKRGILARQSRAAAWCRLIGALALPVLVLAALGSRIGLVPSPALIPVLVLGFSLALLALALGAFALAEIWRSGAEGAGSAIAGILYASPALLALIAVAAASVIYPRLTDISTDPGDPPALAARAAAEPLPPGPAQIELQSEAYPDIAPRLYALPITAVYGAVRTLVGDRGWDVVHDAAPSSMPAAVEAVPVRQAEAADPILSRKATMTQSRGDAISSAASRGKPAAAQDAPSLGAGTLQAVVSTPVFGFGDDVVIRVRETPEGTRVDMRSASRTGMHDLGQNARRIRSFFAGLDAALQPDPNAPVPAGPVVATPVAEALPEAAGPAIE